MQEFNSLLPRFAWHRGCCRNAAGHRPYTLCADAPVCSTAHALLPLHYSRILAVTAIAAFFAAANLWAAPAPAKVPVRVTIGGEDLYSLGFETLSAFDYTIVDTGTGATAEQIEAAKKRDQVPSWVRQYQDKRVVLKGYLMPLQLQDGRAKTFFLMKDVTTCCYGAVPNMNDYVVVSMKGDGAPPTQDIPVSLIGVLHIQQKYENGYVTSLYQFDGEKYLGPAQ